MSTRPVGTPAFKTVGFTNLNYTYNYDDKTLHVSNGGREFTFTSAEIAELRAALRSFGLEAGENKTEYRGRG